MAHPLTILTICGSLREKSFNAALLRASAALAPEGLKLVPAPSYAAIPTYDSDLQAKGVPAEVTALGDAIRAADGVLIATPEYNYSVPGGLKNAIDWLSRLQPQPFAGKPVALQSASMGPLGGARVQYHLRQVMVFLDAHLLNKPEIFVGTAQAKFDPDTLALKDETTEGFLRQQLSAFEAFARRWK